MEVAADPQETTSDHYQPTANDVDISIEKNGGLYKEILREGHGADHPLTSDNVTVHYVGTLLNGEQFDSSRDRGETFQFQLKLGKVIKGWDDGVATMRKGELAKLTCSPEYAYGERGAPPAIPPNSTLSFEVELFDWKGTDISPGTDESILKSSLLKGKYGKPNEGSAVEVYIIGRHDGRVFEEREVSFVQGEGAEHGVVEGIDLGVLKLDEGETARLKIAPKYAYGSVGNPTFNIPGGATLIYDVKLKSFEKVKDSWEMDPEEKLEDSETLKQKGTEKFKLGKYGSACKNYRKIVDYLDQESGLAEEQEQKRKALLLSAHLNTALCELKLGNDVAAFDACDKAIELDPNSEKAFFRRGTARLNMQNFEDALEDFNYVLKISPDNKAAKNQITLVHTKLRQQKQKEKQLFSNMFEKFAKIDAQKEKLSSNENEGEHEKSKEQETVQEGQGDAPENPVQSETS